MVRLIDAGALFRQVSKNLGSTTMYLPIDFQEEIIDAPTIDAIPMWWITEKFLDVLNKDKALSRAAWLVRKAWIEEQGASK